MNAQTWEALLEYFDFRQFFAQNSPFRLLLILALICALFVAAHLLCAFIQKKLENYVVGRSQGKADKLDAMDLGLFERVIRNTRIILDLGILFWGAHSLIVGPLYEAAINIIFTALLIWAGIEFCTAFIPFNIDLYLRRHGATLKTSQTRSLMPIVTAVIWAIGLTFLLDNLGLHVSTIIAGLGIVGVAVGLAGKAILEDFFSYIVILLDKPFRIGDYVELGDGKAGDVEYMGPKTTHLRNLEEDLIVCANSEMTRGILVNLGNSREREVLIEIGVAYETPPALLKRVPEILREVVESFPQCTFNRACMLSFGQANLQFQLLYFVHAKAGGIREFMNTRSEVNIAIVERFAAEGLSMSYPTTHVLLTESAPAVKNILPSQASAKSPNKAGANEQSLSAEAQNSGAVQNR